MLTIYNEDCLVGMSKIPDNSIDLIICDLPYNVTKASHDVLIPMNDYITIKKKNITLQEYLLLEYKKGTPYKEALTYFENNCNKGLWNHYHRVIKENGAIILFGQDKFTSYLMESNKKEHRYNLIWEKLGQPSGFLNANKMPLRSHEDILVFYKKLPTYNPQKTKGSLNHSRGLSKKPVKNKNYGDFYFVDNSEKLGDLKHPKSILKFNKPHPPIFSTQKSVELVEWLIKSYSNENETILDNCLGSGTTAIACINTNRNFIGFEKEKEYFNNINERISNYRRNHEK